MEKEEVIKPVTYFTTVMTSKYRDLNWFHKQESTEISFERTSGLIRNSKLHLLALTENTICSEMNVDRDEEDNKDQKYCKTYFDADQQISNAEKQIIELYFIKKMKPGMISSITKQPKNRVYAVVESIKKFVIKTMNMKAPSKSGRPCIAEEVKEAITKYCESKANHYFTIIDVCSYVEVSLNKKGIVSTSAIRRFMRNNLKLRYKRISTRPPKVMNSDIVSKQIAFWKFYSIWKNQHLNIIQVDEF